MEGDPLMNPGVSNAQGISNTQMNMPPQAGPAMDPAMAAMMGGGMPMQPPAPQKKPPTLIPTDVSRLLAEALNKTKLEAAKGLAGYLGDPRGTVRTRERELLRVWRKRNPAVDPLYEKFVNKRSDEEIMQMMYPARRALIRYGRRTYTEQVEFAEYMAKLNVDPRFDDLDKVPDDEEEDMIPPQAEFPSAGEENFEQEVRLPEEEEE